MAEVQIARCDCRCGPLVVVWASCTKTASYAKGGLENIDPATNEARPNGRKYLSKTIVSTNNYHAGSPLNPPDRNYLYTLTDVRTYHPSTDTYTEVETQAEGMVGDGSQTYTYTLGDEYSDEDFLADAKAKFALVSFSAYPDLTMAGVRRNLTGEGPDAQFQTSGNNGITRNANLTATSGPSVVRYNSGGPLAQVTFASAKYMPVVLFDAPWMGVGTISARWRERTAHYTATETSVYQAPDPTISGAPDYSTTATETGTRTFAHVTDTLSPAAGDLYGVGTEHLLDGTALTAGDVVKITGPGDLDSINFLLGASGAWSLGIAQILQTGSASKRGARPYIHDATAGAKIPVYQLETASGQIPGPVIPGLPAFPPQPCTGFYQFGTSFLPLEPGSAVPDPIPDGYDRCNFANVDRALTSSFDTDEAVPGYLAGSSVEAVPAGSELDRQAREATVVTPTQITWRAGLVLTLSQEYPTAAMRHAPDQAVALEFTGELGTGSAEVAEVTLASRNLPAHELSYEVMRSNWRPVLDAMIDPGIPSQYGLDAPVASSGSVTISYKRVLVDLDTGERSESTQTGTVFFDVADDPVLTQITAVIEPVPGTNQRVSVYDFAVVAVDAEYVQMPAVARITGAG